MGQIPVEYFQIMLAGQKIEIECNYRMVLNKCIDYLASFEKPDIIVSVSKEEIVLNRPEIPELHHQHDSRISIRYADENVEPNLVYKKIAEAMLAYNTYLMHGAVVATNGFAYMFSAPSGTGKTTRAKVWIGEFPKSIVVNGDKPLIKVTDSEVFACGTPWCGKEELNTNIIVPLKAIFLIERNDESNDALIEEVSIGKAFPYLLQQTYLPADPTLSRKTIQLLKSLNGKVKFYKLCGVPSPKTIHLAYETACAR